MYRVETGAGRTAFVVTVRHPQAALVEGATCAVRRQRGNHPVGRVDDQGCPSRADDFRSELPPPLVVRAIEVRAPVRATARRTVAVAAIAILNLQRLLLERGGFLGGQERLALELRGALEGRERGVAPRTLQIRMAIAGTRYRGLLCRRHRNRCHQDETDSYALHAADNSTPVSGGARRGGAAARRRTPATIRSRTAR